MIKTQTNTYDSSTIEASTYIYETKDLFINFKFGLYKYLNVSEEDYIKFSTDKSQGIALNTIIKGVYEYEKLDDI
jgi:hypothetical protein